MRKVFVATGTAFVLLGAAPALALQAGAPGAAPTENGHWGSNGWQADAAASSAATPAAAALPAQQVAPSPMRPMAPSPAPAIAPPPPMSMAGRNSWGNLDSDYYRPLHPGQRLKGHWLDDRYTVNDWQQWGLGRPGPGMRWVRYHDVALLIDARGHIIDQSDPLDWDVPHTRTGPDGAYAAGGPAPFGPPQLPHVPTITTTRTGPDTVVTVREVMPVVDYAAYPGAFVTITPGTITTTTTTVCETAYRPIRHARGHSKLLWR